jgi:hypothetical protein
MAKKVLACIMGLLFIWIMLATLPAFADTPSKGSSGKRPSVSEPPTQPRPFGVPWSDEPRFPWWHQP